MFRTRVLMLLLFVKMASSFSWDIVVGADKKLEFYQNGTLTHTEEIPLVTRITSVTYDPVHYRVLFADVNHPNMSICSYDLSTRKTQSLFTKTTNDYYVRVVYDPVTQLLVWKETYCIYTFSLNPASSNKLGDGNLVVTTSDQYCCDVAVDSCGGYIYWITDAVIARAQLDGSERIVLIDSSASFRTSLAIDQQTQRMYWIDILKLNDKYETFIESSDFNGRNKTTLYIAKKGPFASSLGVSKDFIYWQNSNELGTWQVLKNSSEHVPRQVHSISRLSTVLFQRLAANYTIKEQIEGVKNCGALQDLMPNNTKPECAVSICPNYCLNGNCSVNAGGQPTCSCKAGYSGERCEVSACHDYCLHGGVCSLNEENKRVCQCTAGYEGERCDISICNEYCVQGNCSVGADGLPKCSCTAGYSGERCEENACRKHCLNGGVCSLNEEDEPACQCTAGYGGRRCEVFANKENSCDADNSGEATVSACRRFCLNNGVCSLNEASEPVCQCTADYEGQRCDVPAFVVKWFLYAYKNVPPVALSEAVKSTRASTVV